ncbi:class I SAM-dependent methyltransferase [Candidatus Daviesbacteria bacterium]|nr:class I SAM-dependent methyltransferase [Candidatus Daviesbacteria bacterium]
MTQKTLHEIHEDVPADHYDKGIRHNLFQKYWHYKRFNEVLKFVDEVKGPFLDIGCHSGTFSQKILNKTGSKQIYGLDISKPAIQKIKTRIPFGNFKCADATHLPYKDNFFDAVFCLEMLEHVDYPRNIISEIKRVLKKGGYALILVPTDNKLFKIIWTLWTLYYPVWKHAHVQSFTNSSLENLIKENKLRIKEVKKFNLNMLKLIKFEK